MTFCILLVGEPEPRQANLTCWSQTGSRQLCCVSGARNSCSRVRREPDCLLQSSFTLAGRATGLGSGEPKGEEAGARWLGLELWLSFGSQTRGAVGKLGAEQQREVIRFVIGGWGGGLSLCNFPGSERPGLLFPVSPGRWVMHQPKAAASGRVLPSSPAVRTVGSGLFRECTCNFSSNASFQ